MKKTMLKTVGRHAKRTVLIVGEGYSEVAFLEHLKSLNVERGRGISVKIGNTRGKGPDHVLDNAIRQSNNGAYDAIAVLMDTESPGLMLCVIRQKQSISSCYRQILA